MNRLGRALKVRSGEGRTAALGVALIMAAAVGATFGQSGADALFFARSGVDTLPVMLLVSGALLFGASLVVTAVLGRLSPRRLFLALPLIAAGVVLVERALVAAGVGWIYPILWLTVGVAQMVQGLFTWGMYGMVVDTRQAKRLFPLFGAGWILGWVVGGVLTRPLAAAIGAENLLFVWAGGLVAAFVFGRAMLGRVRRRPDVARRRSRRPTPGLLDEMQQGFRSVRASPVMRWMSLAAMLFSVLFFSLYLPFSRAAAQRYPDADALAGFFGLFSAVTAGAALLWSLFLTGRLFARFGVTTMLLVFPVIYLAGFGILIVNAAFATVVVFRFAQMLWMQSVANPAWEAVINVLPPTRRDQTRAFLNGAPAQAGTAIAGVIQLVGAQALSSKELSAIGAGTAALTTFACWRVRRSYAAALLDALRAGRPQVFPAGSDEESLTGRGIDAAAVATVLAGVADEDVHVRRASVQILGGVPGDEAVAALEAALRDGDVTVRATALESLAGTRRAAGRAAAARALSDPEAAVRVAAVRAVVGLGGGSPQGVGSIRGLLGDKDPAVRSAAACALLRKSPDDQALEVVRAMLASEDPADRLMTIEGLGGWRSPMTFDLCADRIGDPNPRVRVAAARALGVSEPARAVPVLVGALGDRDPDVRAAVGWALGWVGTPPSSRFSPRCPIPPARRGPCARCRCCPGTGHATCSLPTRRRRRRAHWRTSTFRGRSRPTVTRRRACCATGCSTGRAGAPATRSPPRRSSGTERRAGSRSTTSRAEIPARWRTPWRRWTRSPVPSCGRSCSCGRAPRRSARHARSGCPHCCTTPIPGSATAPSTSEPRSTRPKERR